MKAYEITEKTIEALSKKQAQFLRINFPNGDMVGHTGNLQATILAMNAVDLMLNRLLVACKKTETILMVTADHGNCEEMFRAKEKDYPLWEQNYQNTQPPPKTSHTLSQVPFYVFDPRKELSQITVNNKDSSLANIANTILSLMGLTPREDYESSLLKKK
jgi:2,3-bisphosphoglycerate-independent phosphoglycerate mutase